MLKNRRPDNLEMIQAARNARGAAIWYAKKDEHHAAARLYDEAAELWDAAGFRTCAGMDRIYAERERRLARPTPPPNVSALVD